MMSVYDSFFRNVIYSPFCPDQPITEAEQRLKNISRQKVPNTKKTGDLSMIIS